MVGYKMWKRKRKAPQPQKTISEGSATSMSETDKDTARDVGEMPMTLLRGDSVNPVIGTRGLEYLVPRWIVAESMATKTAYEEP